MGLDDIRRRIAAAEAAAGRPAGSVTLVAVSKLQPPERVEAVLEAGAKVFGENYVQEAQGKWPALKAQFPGVRLHLIGPLQSNKAREAVALFDVIHSLDRLSLAGNYEINIELTDKDVAARMEEIFATDAENCAELTLEEWRSRGTVARTVEGLLSPWRPIL